MKYLKTICFLITLFISYLSFAQVNYNWEKLNTESYKGKQDDIFFIDENTGWYINGFGKIFHTKDAGKTWKLQLEKKVSLERKNKEREDEKREKID